MKFIISTEIKTTSNIGDKKCRVIPCTQGSGEELTEVFLESNQGEKFLFSAFFCITHTRMYSKFPTRLVEDIRHNLISGIDSSIF